MRVGYSTYQSLSVKYGGWEEYMIQEGYIWYGWREVCIYGRGGG